MMNEQSAKPWVGHLLVGAVFASLAAWGFLTTDLFWGSLMLGLSLVWVTWALLRRHRGRRGH